jgi:nucleoside 2-deoxyribosyltransferase
MSFGGNAALEDHYKYAIKPTIESFDLDCIRVDELQYNGKITDQIISSIQNAHFIIADLTMERPNCYYELGYAHALNKAVIHTANKGSVI